MLTQSGSSLTAFSTIDPLMRIFPFSMAVLSLISTSVILMCFLSSVRMTFFSPVPSAGAAGTDLALTLSKTSLVIGVKASTSCKSVLPKTSSMVKPASLSVSRPASTISSNSVGSSRSSAPMTVPLARRQQKTAGSVRCFCKVSFVIDIQSLPLCSISYALMRRINL